MYKLIKIFVPVIVLVLIFLFVPVVPKLNNMGYGIPGCKVVELRKLTDVIYNQDIPNTRYQTAPIEIRIVGRWNCTVN